MPVESRLAEASCVLPLLNATVPVGMPVPELCFTFAVNVTAWPAAAEPVEIVSVVVVAIGLTTSDCAVDELAE